MIGDGHKSQSERTYEQDFEAVQSAWSKLEQTEPPALIDQSIQGAAERALAGRPRRWTTRWIGGLATAAVVVLALTIVLQQGPEGLAPPVPETDGYEVEASPAVSHEKQEPEVPEAQDAETLQREPLHARKDRRAAVASDAPVAVEEPKAIWSQTAPEGAADPGQPDSVEAEVWIERLLQLQREGRRAELSEELAAFRKAYPGHPLPPELDE